MYSLIVTSEAGVWDGKRYSMPFDRVGGYTAEALKAKYRRLDDTAIAELTSHPTLFAYETQVGLPARLGRVTRIAQRSGSDVRFDFSLFEGIPPIPAEQLAGITWDLDIGDWELNRIHWAFKDIDILEALRDAGLLPTEVEVPAPPSRSTGRAPQSLSVAPSVFAIPSEPRDDQLVAVMMPFAQEFDATFRAVQQACRSAGLRAERADDIWDNSTIIQDVFSLIYRSQVVVVDLSGHNSNVMYEAGIAHTLGRAVVPISRSNGGLPFDLAHHRTLAYLPNEQGLSEMQQKLERRLRRLTA